MAVYKRRVINVSNVKRFVDKHDDTKRVGEAFIQRLNEQVANLIIDAVDRAHGDGRSTLMERDLD